MEADYKDFILNNLSDSLIITDHGKYILFSSLPYLALTGYTIEELKGKSYLALVSEECKERENITASYPFISNYESTHIKKDGNKIELSVKCIAITNMEGNKEGYAFIIKDLMGDRIREKEAKENLEKINQVTKYLTQAHNDLFAAKISAEAANKAKSMFLANMSHELRSPLSAIIGFSELLNQYETISRKEVKDMTGVILKSARNLLDMLNEILDLSKIEAGKIVIEKRHFHLEELLLHIITLMEVKLKDKDVGVDMDISEEIPEIIVTDELRLRQILVNIMTNAIKFTSKGYVKLNAELSENKDYIIFSVIDTGIGIPKEKLKNIFEPFSQADKSTSRKYGGTGLGLTITEKLVTLLGGKIWVESEVDMGSRFYFTIPINGSPEKEDMHKEVMEMPEEEIPFKVKTKPQKEKSEIKILLVDDEEEIRELLKKILQENGYNVTTTVDGLEALEYTGKEIFDLIIMDIAMPSMDGVEVTKRIRQLPEYKVTPIIACTGAIIGEIIEQLTEAEIDDYIIKPVEVNVLMNMIKRLTG